MVSCVVVLQTVQILNLEVQEETASRSRCTSDSGSAVMYLLLPLIFDLLLAFVQVSSLSSYESEQMHVILPIGITQMFILPSGKLEDDPPPS